jgi:adenosylmethionine-8-amino-7-oxononanoate aminotransferase
MNPLSMAIGAAVLKYVKENDLVKCSRDMGGYLLEQLNSLRDLEIVGDVRGIGMFCGIEFVKDQDTKAPFSPSQKVNAMIFNTAFKRGLITYPGAGGADGINGDHTLICPPFIITKDQIDTLVNILRETIKEVIKELGR